MPAAFRSYRWLFAAILAVALVAPACAAEVPAKVYVILWFDTEDYILPASDDAALRDWGMRVYLDSGSHVALDGKPHYYGGLLTLYKLTYVLRTRLGGAEDLKEAEDRFVAAREKLRAEGGGIVSIYYHPCEFV